MKGKKFGGRQKGTINKKNQAVEETARRLGIDLFETLCLFAMGDWKRLGYDNECFFAEKPDGVVKMGYVISPEMRLKATEQACKYLYSPKQAVDPNTGTSAVTIKIVDYTKSSV